ncbi:MAG: TolB family protein, partial [Mycobacterium leprae]
MRTAWYIRLRRQAYTAILAVLFAGFAWFTAGEAEGTVAAEVALPAVVPATTLHSLTEGKSLDGFGAFATDGSQIAFMRDGRIWVMSVGGTDAQPVTKPETDWDAVPAWRPGSEQIAYVRHAREGGKAEVRLLELASGKEQQLAVENVSIGHVAWSPDGKSLYYTTAQRLMQVTVVSRKSRQVLGVSADWEMLAGGLVITRDGKQAIFGAGRRTERGADYNLWRAPLTGRGQPEQLTRTGGIMPALDAKG